MIPVISVIHFLVESRPRRNINLTAEYRPDACFLALFVELHAAEHDAVVRNSQGGLAQFLGPGYQLVDARGTIQQTVFGMYVKMGVTHG